MRLLLTIVLILSGIIFIWSVLFMSPKWGLGAAIGGAAGNSEYGWKKSAEWKLKKVAIATSLIFITISLILPYVN